MHLWRRMMVNGNEAGQRGVTVGLIGYISDICAEYLHPTIADLTAGKSAPEMKVFR